MATAHAISEAALPQNAATSNSTPLSSTHEKPSTSTALVLDRPTVFEVRADTLWRGIREGDKIVVAPDLNPEPGDFVLIDTTKGAYIWRLNQGDIKCLKAHNRGEENRLLSPTCKIVGVVVEVRHGLRPERKQWRYQSLLM